jgi:HEAT repeat protein
LHSQDANVRIWCAQELWRIGPYARGAVPALLSAMQNGDLRAITALRALAIIGPGAYTNEVLQAMQNGLRSKDREVRWAAIDSLSGLTDTAAPAVPALVKIMNGDDPQLAETALRTLARIGHLPKELKPKLEELIGAENAFRRAGAAVALLRIEPDDARAISVVRECLDSNRSPNVRSSTLYLLSGIGRDAKPFESELRRLVQDSDANVKTFARDALRALQPEGRLR